MDVNHEAVRAAFRKVGDQLEAERRQRVELRNAAHVAAGGRICGRYDWRTKQPCTHVAVARLAAGTPVCSSHLPEQPQPGCSKPLLCYKPCCASKLPALSADVARRHAVAVDQNTWTNELRAEIERLAATRSIFTLAELAEYAGRGRAERVLNVLDAAVTHGLIEKHPREQRWRGTGVTLERVYTPTPPTIDVDSIERENRYQ